MPPHPVTPLSVDTKSKNPSPKITFAPSEPQLKRTQVSTAVIGVKKKKTPAALVALGVLFFPIGIAVCAMKSHNKRKARRLALQKEAENLNILVSPPLEDIKLDENNRPATPTMLPPVSPEDFSIVTILTLPPETDQSLLMPSGRPPTPVRRRISSVSPTRSGRNSPTPSSGSSRSSVDSSGSVNIIVDDGRKGRGDGRKTRSDSRGKSASPPKTPDSPLTLEVPSFDTEGALPTTGYRTPSLRSVASE
ncbi:hypothetical protein BDK51DRAFT_47369 [Blyttiomyces helicus]|uniref:Uncharacterized protein n=1 Tax=Blyttiomyces helicus TaxID=388810 RepID=A0A4P9W527_9FUNG|nr:hypothetical protein BDK51DRAFT_47369 [Blyttiomyces helicus]|eukprot:RKO85998.1 hypothetical protein BDK51DRAFT_47369 [Blyttiomyces helicus]